MADQRPQGSIRCGVAWLASALAAWRIRERLEPVAGESGGGESGGGESGDGADITVLIPARNEERQIADTVAAVMSQAPALRLIVIDDESTDSTAKRARAAAPGRVEVMPGEPLPAGWTGKLWALQQGLQHVSTPLVLLLDADIVLRPGMLAALRRKQREERRALVSVMAQLRMVTGWERLLLPPFVWFFKLLYPFALANGPNPCGAAAAGGCMLVERRWLDAIGGFAAIRGAIIDDCALAAAIKRAGGRVWIGLTHGAVSQRECRHLGDITAMVTRTAFTQLRYSFTGLIACSIMMVLVFWGPVAAMLLGTPGTRLAGAGLFGLLVGTYVPLLRYYGLTAAWALSLPVAATLYLGMTWLSAWQYLRGTRARWRGRRYTA